MDSAQDVNDLRSRLQASALPDTPYEALVNEPRLEPFLSDFDKSDLIEHLASLLSRPEFHSANIRLDWAIRLSIAHADGQQKPSEHDLTTLLNEHLVSARVTHREDPIENLFAERLCRPTGNTILLNGTFGPSTAQTQTVYNAFLNLPDGAPKRGAIGAVDALLSINQVLAQRFEWSAGGESRIEPTNPIETPLRRGVRFTAQDLRDLSVAPETLGPFIQETAEQHSIDKAPPGNSLLEVKPLIRSGEDILVAAPHCIGMAVRAHLVSVAYRFRLDRLLQSSIMQNDRRVLVDAIDIELPRLDYKLVKAWQFGSAMVELAPGRWVHLIHTVEALASNDIGRFGRAAIIKEELGQALNDAIEKAQTFAREHTPFEAGMTLWITSGWGAGTEIDLGDKYGAADWPLYTSSVPDLEAMGLAINMTLPKLWRLAQQRRDVERLGFELSNLSGLINLVAWWNKCDHTFFPSDTNDFTPPALVQLPTNQALGLRIRSEHRTSRQMRTLPDGTARLTWQFDREPIDAIAASKFVSIKNLRSGELLGGVELASQPVWLNCVPGSAGCDTDALYTAWEAALNWLAHLLAQKPIASAIGARRGPCLVQLTIEPPQVSIEAPSEQEMEDLLSVSADREDQLIEINIPGDWHAGLKHHDNRAEICLAAALCQGLTALSGANTLSRAQATDLIRSTLGSSTLRWQHARAAITATDCLIAKGQLDRPYAIDPSAAALICSGRRDMIEGSVLLENGATETLLTHYRDQCLSQIVLTIRQYDKRLVLIACLEMQQAAIASRRYWEVTASAVTETLGADADMGASLKNTQEAFQTLRATTILAEIAHCEAGKTGENSIPKMQLDELLALALQVFEAGDVLAAARHGFGADTLGFAPGGELIYGSEWEVQMIWPMLLDYHKIGRAAERERADQPLRTEATIEPPPDFEACDQAFHAEFGVSFEDTRDIAFGCALLTEKYNQSVFETSLSVLDADLIEQGVFSASSLRSALHRLTLPLRDAFFRPEYGVTRRDLDLARMGRGHSLATRPILALENSADPRVLIAPALLQRSFEYLAVGAWSGTLQHHIWRSETMARYAGQRGHETGRQFNKEVCEAIQALGLEAWAEAKPTWATNAQSSKQTKALGDVDVLAVDKLRNRVWVIEAKNLKFCRTRSETARRMSDYRGNIDDQGRPDKMLRHLRRVSYLRDHSVQLKTRLKLAEAPEVRGLMVVNTSQPLIYDLDSKNPDARTIRIDQLAEIFNAPSIQR